MGVKFRHANIHDVNTYYEWANDEMVRNMSFSTNKIKYDDHVSWFSDKLKNPNYYFYFFTNEEDIPVGQVRIVREKSETVIGISVDSQFRGQSLSSILLIMSTNDYLSKYPREIIHAFIKKNNQASIKSFEKAGFSQKEDVIINGFESFLLKKQMNRMIPNHTFIIAELSANHNHDLQIAKDTIRAAKQAGADAIKIQTYTADTMTLDCKNEYFQIKSGTIWDGTSLYELYLQAYTPWEWHKELQEEANKEGLIFFSTPFDFTATDFLEKLNVPIYKIASFEITDIPLIEYVASKGKPIIISTGIATLSEIEDAVNACRKVGNHQITLLKCTSSYPAPIDEANLLTIPNMKETFGVEVGLSDHTMGTTAAICAVALGAKVIEKHFILDRKIGGPDASFSMEPAEFSEMVKAIRDVEKALGAVNYTITEKVKGSKVFARSLFIAKDMKAGDTFTTENVRSVRPGYGLPPKYLPEILGKKSSADLKFGTPLKWEYVAQV